MGIYGLLKHLGSGKRTSLAALAAQHYVEHQRPFRLAIDIAIWLFQIQAGQGGSNPALRTFYYRLLRLLSLNIHPVFVFDGPNKPLFKRNKRVGGPGVRVASVPEFFAKQLLKSLGFPMHFAPGEAEAECALLQREGVVDAVLSEDVDTIMFGSRLTLRNWTTEGSSKTPTHVDVYNESEIYTGSGLDTQGMILVALMSGGDYIPEGIPGCGPVQAVAAAKAGFGRRLCAMNKNDTKALSKWREELQMEFQTNVSNCFSRRNTKLVVPEDFPNFEVLNNYTTPCVSSATKVEQLRRSLTWDTPLDLPALRSFTGDAFEWLDRGGAIKFIRNLAPALLLRQLRTSADSDNSRSQHDQEICESAMLEAIHSTRTHASTDKAVEIRVSFIPAKLVPVDLSLEAIGDNTVEVVDDDEALGAIEADIDDEVPATPSRRKRTFRPYEDGQPEKIWVLREWVQLGCPTMLEDFEASRRVPKPTAKSKASRAGVRKATARPRTKGVPSSANSGMPTNALMQHVRATKSTVMVDSEKDKDAPDQSHLSEQTSILPRTHTFTRIGTVATGDDSRPASSARDERLATTGPAEQTQTSRFKLPRVTQEPPKTPSRRKRRTAEVSTPQSGRSAITSFFTHTATRVQQGQPAEVISLLSSSPTRASPVSRPAQQGRPTKSMRVVQQPNQYALREMSSNTTSVVPDLTAKIRRPRTGLQKSLSMPMSQTSMDDHVVMHDSIECLDLAESPAQARTFNFTAALTQAPATRTNVNVHATIIAQSATLLNPHTAGLEAPTTIVKPSQAAFKKPTVSAIAERILRPIGPVIKIRESLDGAWAIASPETLDLSGLEATTAADTGLVSRAIADATKRQLKTWRLSGVDTLDLTGE